MAIAGIALTKYQTSDAQGNLKGPVHPNAFATLSRVEVLPNRSLTLSMLVYDSPVDAVNNPNGYIQAVDVSVPAGAQYTGVDGNVHEAMADAISMGYATLGSVVLRGAYPQLSGSMVQVTAKSPAEITPLPRVRATQARRAPKQGGAPPNLLPGASPPTAHETEAALNASERTTGGRKKEKRKNPKS